MADKPTSWKSSGTRQSLAEPVSRQAPSVQPVENTTRRTLENLAFLRSEADSLQSRVHKWKQLIDSRLDEMLPRAEDPPNPPIDRAVRHIILSGGYRYRPILLLAVAELLGAHQRSALQMACVVEMIHSAAMILDDLPCFDNAEIRHGKTACHRKFGEEIAILASHRLTTLCVETNWQLRRALGSKIGDALETEYTTLIARMIRGEAMDLATRYEHLDPTTLTGIYIGKSAHLFAFTAATGALLGRAKSSVTDALRRYGLNIGVAYQILDDVYDVRGGPETIGKPIGVDARNGKATTFPLLYGIQGSLAQVDEYKNRAYSALATLGRKFAILRALGDMIVPTDRGKSEIAGP